jgi:hypothetical protein
LLFKEWQSLRPNIHRKGKHKTTMKLPPIYGSWKSPTLFILINIGK